MRAQYIDDDARRADMANAAAAAMPGANPADYPVSEMAGNMLGYLMDKWSPAKTQAKYGHLPTWKARIAAAMADIELEHKLSARSAETSRW